MSTTRCPEVIGALCIRTSPPRPQAPGRTHGALRENLRRPRRNTHALLVGEVQSQRYLIVQKEPVSGISFHSLKDTNPMAKMRQMQTLASLRKRAVRLPAAATPTTAAFRLRTH
jgi:hypothetical protein